MKKTWLTGALILSLQILFAQTNARKAMVTDSNHQPLTGIILSLLHGKDSSVVKKAVTNEAGQYAFRNVAAGSYLVLAEGLNFAKKYSGVFLFDTTVNEDTFPDLILSAKISELQAVTVKSVKPFIETKIDRTIVNVDALIANAGVTAWDVLQNAPGVIAQDNGNLNLAGKSGVMVFIDDKPTYLSGSDLANYLRSLPSDALEKLEIMTNPPARYDAAGNAGIINIRLKKSKVKGFNGTTNLSYNQSVNYSQNANVLFNYRNNNWALNGLVAENSSGGFLDADNNRQYYAAGGALLSEFNQHIYVKNTRKALNSKISADYYLDKKSTLGIVVAGMIRPSGVGYITDAFVVQPSGAKDSVTGANNFTDEHFANKSVNLNFRHNIDSLGSQLSFDADMIRFDKTSTQSNNSSVFIPSSLAKRIDTTGGNLFSGISIYSVKADYSRVLPIHATIETGGKISYTQTDNPASYYSINRGLVIPNNVSSNHFRYSEQVNTVYANFNKEWTKFAAQFGLRLENTISSGRQSGNAVSGDSSFRRTYTNLFPTVYLQYKFDKASKNQLVWSYGRRISRPSFSDLNPFLSPVDQFTIFTGNPFLRPVFSDNFELRHIFKNVLTTSFSLGFTHDEIIETVELVGSKEYDRPGNVGKSTVARLAVNASLHPAKWWTINGFTEYQHRHYNTVVYGQKLDTAGHHFGVNLVNQFTLKKNWTLEQGGYYRGPTFEGQQTLIADYVLNISVRKRFWNNKASVRLSFRDLFYTHVNAGVTNGLPNTASGYYEKFDSRSVGVTFSYSFGKLIKDQRKHDEGSAADEKSRVN
ncbi:MAG: TonB-dependent receptor [Bacteroidota bacterium]